MTQPQLYVTAGWANGNCPPEPGQKHRDAPGLTQDEAEFAVADLWYGKRLNTADIATVLVMPESVVANMLAKREAAG